MTLDTIRRKPQILTLWGTSEGASPARPAVSRGVGDLKSPWCLQDDCYLTYYIYSVYIYSVYIYV